MELYQIGNKIGILALRYDTSCNSCYVHDECVEMETIICYILKKKYKSNIDYKIIEPYNLSLYKNICLKYTYQDQ